VKAPRITGGASEPPPFAGEVPSTLRGLGLYANAPESTAELPMVMPASSRPRLHPRRPGGRLVSLALLSMSALTLALVATIAVREFGGAPGPTTADPSVVVATAGRRGTELVDCMSDIVGVAVTHVGARSGVMLASIETSNGTARLVLRAADTGYRGYFYVNAGVLRTDAQSSGLLVLPDERLLVRIDGLPYARELRVSGRLLRVGSRWEGPCA
jgi:hypothetical protein